jgi:LysR family transcriptional regulator for metE and metH
MLAVGPQHKLAQQSFIQPSDLEQEILIMYPVERDRLDIFTRFLDPSDVEPKEIRTAELTAMVVQLVASGRGVASLPNWSLAEYEPLKTVVAKSLGEHGLWATLYAAIREDQQDAPFMEDFLATASDTCFATLQGIKRVTK